MQHILLGSSGEDYAAKLLSERGYQVIARNFRTKVGEIDIVAREKETLIFVEVKTRASTKYGLPHEVVNQKRILRITRAGQIFVGKYYPKITKLKIMVVSLIMENGKIPSVKIIDVI